MFGVLKWLWRGVLVSVLLLSLAINIASFMGAALWKTASIIWEGASGTRSYLTSQVEKVDFSKEQSRLATSKLDDEITSRKHLTKQLADLQSDLVSERKLSQRVSGELASAQTEALTNQRTIRKLQQEMADPSTRLVRFKGRSLLLKEAVAETADGVSRRAAKTASRELASMPGEAIPFWGTAVIVGVTSLEFYDLCQTIKDMNTLKQLFDPELEPDPSETTVCSMRVPTKEQLWATTKAAPGLAWEAARKATPTLAEIKEWEIPQVDAAEMWASTKDGTAKFAGWLKRKSASAGSATLDKANDLVGRAGEAVSSGMDSLTSKTKGLLSIGDD